MSPVSFGGRFGWLHLPPPSSPLRGGVVFCPPLGRDARSAHRPMMLFARRLAALGFAVLRYDHLGAGDSLDASEGADLWANWRRGVVEAADFVRARTGVTALALAGLGLGASLAALEWEAARARALLLLAPVVRGGAWIRELRLSAQILRVNRPGGSEDVLDADGMRLSPELTARLAELDLHRLERAPSEVFLAASGPARKLEVHLRELGARVSAPGFDGYDQLVRDSFANEPPDALFARASGWIDDIAAVWPTHCAPSPPSGSPEITGPGWRERPVSFGAGLQGVLCAPTGEARPTAVLFPNTGGDPRWGIGRLAVRASRELAQRGLASLRFDLAGLGDSDFCGAWRSHVYETPRGEDFTAALDLLGANGFDEALIAGICSGAYHGVHAALDERRIVGVFAVNPGDWLWPEGHSMIEPTREEILSGRALLRGLAREVLTSSGRARLWRGESRSGPAVRELGIRLRRMLTEGVACAETRRLRSRTAAMLERGTRLKLIIGLSDWSLDELEFRFGRRGAWLRGRPGVDIVISPVVDHGVSSETSRSLVLEELIAFAGG